MEQPSNVIEMTWKKLSLLFHGLCWVATTSVVSYWIYIFSLNDDLCTVDYRKYYEEQTDHYPVLSLCFKNPFSSTKLRMVTPEINETSYLKFLRGEYFSPEMLDIDYKNVTMDISEYAMKYFLWWRNGTIELVPLKNDESLFEPTFSGFWLHNFFKCYGMKIPPNSGIQQLGVLMKNEVFPNGIRPHSLSFFTLLHYPNQLLRSVRSINYMWPKIVSNATYETVFKINKMEMIRRRNKRARPCHDSANYDDRILAEHTSKVGCNAPYQEPSTSIRPCSTMHEIKQALLLLRTDEYGSILPCRAMEKIIYTTMESDMSGTQWNGTGEFWISYSFYDQYFQEIIKTRY